MDGGWTNAINSVAIAVGDIHAITGHRATHSGVVRVNLVLACNVVVCTRGSIAE